MTGPMSQRGGLLTRTFQITHDATTPLIDRRARLCLKVAHNRLDMSGRLRYGRERRRPRRLAVLHLAGRDLAVDLRVRKIPKTLHGAS
jgi:hypothetical protein